MDIQYQEPGGEGKHFNQTDRSPALAYDSFTVVPLGEFMQKIEIVRYFEIGALTTVIVEICGDKDAGAIASKEDREELIGQVNNLSEHLKRIDMHHSLAQADEACRALETNITWGGAKAKIESLRVATRTELNRVFVGYIPSDRAKFWDVQKPFGDNVYDNFASARPDLTAAGNCYAIEQYTACVFHSMRAAEKGMLAIAKERKIKSIKGRPLAWNDWGVIIKAIDAKADELAAKFKRGPRLDKALEFYRDAAGELRGFKDAFRNYVTHDRATYDPHQAASAYQRVGGFMQRLATHLSEDTKGIIKW